MAHKEFIDYLKNVEGGPISTFLGLVMFLFGGAAIYFSRGSENPISWASLEVGIFAVGIVLLIKSDKWLKSRTADRDWET